MGCKDVTHFPQLNRKSEMKSVPKTHFPSGYALIEEMIGKVINQVKSNEIERISKVSFNFRSTSPVVSFHNCFKFLGEHQVCAWKNKPYSSNPKMIIATFKVKIDGNQLMQFNVTTGAMLTEVYGNTERNALIQRIRQAIQDKLVDLAPKEAA